MGKVQRGVIKPPNEASARGNKLNSCGPMTHEAPATKAPNAKIHDGDPKNGFMSLSKQANTCTPPNAKHRFKVEDADKGYTEVPVASPGEGAIPVNPFTQSGNAMTSMPLRDTAKRGK